MMFLLTVFLSIGFSRLFVVNADVSCIPKNLGEGKIVCVCNETYCDEIQEPIITKDKKTFIQYVSNEDGLRFFKSESQFVPLNANSSSLTSTTNKIVIDVGEEYQEIFGFGGALTDATGINAFSLQKGASNNLCNSYFGKNGIGYSMVRIPIAGTDFSTHGYSYDDGEEDANLTNFKLAPEDHKYKLPLIKKIKSLAADDQVDVKFFASVWSSPVWMKSNNEFNGIGFIKEEFYETWAQYFIKFFESYKKEGIDFWGVTTQNEPATGFFPSFLTKINSIAWFPDQMIKFVTEHLGPAIRKSEFSHLKLMCFDDQRIIMELVMNKLYANEEFFNYTDGIAYHWYLNFIAPPSIMDKMHEKYPEKFILMTEACTGSSPLDFNKVDLGSWSRGEDYFSDILDNMNHWGSGWIDWNMALDLQGGPTYIKNYVDSPIIVNSTANEFYKQPMFYALGHFAKFVKPGSKRVKIDIEKLENDNVKVTAFKRKDDAVVVQVLNKNDKEMAIEIEDERKGIINATLPKKSFNTFIYA